RYCIILFDEVYVKPSLRFSGCHTIGYSEDAPRQIARTVLALMVKSFMGGPAYVARLIPIYSLQPAFLYDQVVHLVQLIHQLGGTVVSLICDNHFTNRNCFQLLQGDSAVPWLAKNPADPDQPLFLLYDPVHLMKNIRNNWLTQSFCEIDFQPVIGEPVKRAKWNEITRLEEASRNHIVRTTRLNPVACRPSPLERQKVSLVLDVFHEKTVAALQLNGYSETADFVERVLNFWTVVNVKSPESHIRLNDIRRAPISSTNSSAIQELLSFAAVVDRMPGGRGASRPRSLTTETRKAIHQTANGLADLSRHLLMKVSCRLTGLRGSFLFIGKATAGVIIYPLIKFWPVRGYAECNFTVNWS
uniref:Transposable element P transposase n=1 Tax=Macrostomum lignano TaxID=282301 RepID=A0A1I8JBV1_9PLAT